MSSCSWNPWKGSSSCVNEPIINLDVRFTPEMEILVPWSFLLLLRALSSLLLWDRDVRRVMPAIV